MQFYISLVQSASRKNSLKANQNKAKVKTKRKAKEHAHYDRGECAVYTNEFALPK